MKRSANTSETPFPPAKAHKFNGTVEDRFSLDGLRTFQKEALWRQMKENRQAFERELARSETLTRQRDALALCLNYLLKCLHLKSCEECESILKGMEKDFLIDAENTTAFTICTQLIDGFPAGQAYETDFLKNQAFDHSRLVSAQMSIEELKSYSKSLVEELELKDRKCLRLEMELINALSDQTQSRPESVSPSVENETSSIKDSKSDVLQAELNALILVGEKRLGELKSLQNEKERYRSKLEALEARLRAFPDLLERDPRNLESALTAYKALKEEVNSRISISEELGRHIGESLSKRSQAIEALETEMRARRYAAKEFADSLELEVARMRKDRDHMRELYEAANMQVSSLNKHIAQLTALNDQITAKLSLTDSKLKGIIEGTKNSEHSESLILAEIESIGEAFDNLQKQNKDLLSQLSEKDQILAKISGEKLKAEFSLTQCQREADLTKQKAFKIESDSLRSAERAESDSKRLRTQNDQMERSFLERSSECDSLKWKVLDLNRQLTEVKSAYDLLNSKMSDSALVERLRLADHLGYEIRRLEERLSVATAKVDAYSSSTGDALISKDLQSELAIYKKLMKCNSCHTREKNTILTKCFHVFCKECIDTRLETRQRKCPNCGESFGSNDVKPVYL